MSTSVVIYTDNIYDNNSDMKVDFDVSSMDQQEAKEALLKLELRKTQLELASKARDSFITFVKTVWPGFVEGEHHIRIGEKFEKVLSGEIKRLIVNMPLVIQNQNLRPIFSCLAHGPQTTDQDHSNNTHG